MNTTVKFAKVKENAIIPSKRNEDMGFDIYPCFDENYIAFRPHETKFVPTGIASACDPEYGFLLFERGSTGSQGIARRCGVIDSGYRNEWFVCLTNTTDNYMFISKLSPEDTIDDFFVESILGKFGKHLIYPYSKAIAQALIIPVPKTTVEEMSYDELKNIESARGMGALGSSNK